MSSLTFLRHMLSGHSHRVELLLSFLNLLTFTEYDVVPDLSELIELQERLSALIFLRFYG